MISQEAKKNIKTIAKDYDITINFYQNRKGVSGTACVATSTIDINTIGVKKDAIIYRRIFHEIGHIHCFRNGIWRAYHEVHNFSKIKITPEIVRKFRAVAYKAECWVDEWGKKEMAKYFPALSYKIGYKPKDKENIEWLNNYYLDFYNRYKTQKK